jgi:hypothetical protein
MPKFLGFRSFLAPVSAAGSGASVGAAVGGGATNGSVLYVGPTGLLAQDNANFSYDDVDHQLVLGAGTAPKPALILGDDTTGLYRVGLDRFGVATAGVGRWEVNASGHFMAITDNSFDIGASAATRPRSIFAGTSIVAGTTLVQGSNNLVVSTSGQAIFYTLANSRFTHTFTRTAPAGADANPFINCTPGNAGARTASTEASQLVWAAHTDTWSAGAIANQREWFINAPTYAFASASTITTAATFYVAGAPVAGSNATITTSHAAWFGAKIRVDGAVALGGGSAPTLGTIGGSGPTTAAQNEWIEIHTQNGKRFVPAWA